MSFRNLTIAVLTPIGLLSGTIAQAANPDQVQQLLKTNQCNGCDLSGANLAGANLFGANLVGTNLTGANLAGANLSSANLSEANLSGAKLNKASLYRATLEETNLSNADLSNAYLKEATIANVNLQGATLQGTNLSRTNLAGLDFQNVDLTGANLSGANLVQVQTAGLNPRSDIASALGTFFVFATTSASDSCDRNSSSFVGARKQGINIAFANLSGAKLQGANLSQALLAYSDLTGANLKNADLTGAVLVCSKLDRAVLDGAELKNARLNGVVLETVSLNNVKNFNREGTFATQFAVKQEPLQRTARRIVGSINSAQRSFYLGSGQFSNDLRELGVGVDSEGEQYRYRVFTYADRKRVAMQAAVPRNAGFKTYIGLVNTSESNNSSAFSVVCESEEAKPVLPQLPTVFPQNGPMTCPVGFKSVSAYSGPY